MGDAFVGRARELDVLGKAFDDALHGRGGFVLVSGEPGIGKSRLCDEHARRAEDLGARVVWGRAWEGDLTPPFWLLRQVLRRLEQTAATAPLVAQALAASPAVVAVLGQGDAAAQLPEGARLNLSESVADLLRAVASPKPLLVVLDDLHSADLGSLSALAFLSRALKDAPVQFLATTRDVAFHSSPEVTQALARVGREATALPLGRLDAEAVTAWVERAAPALRGEAAALHARAEGNPLFVEELLAIASAGPGLGPSSLGIAGALDAHLKLLSDGARECLEAAAVLGRELSRAQLEALGGHAPDTVRAALDEGVRRRVLLPLGNEGYRFSHVLLRDALFDALPHEAKGPLHRAAARTATDPSAALHHALLGFRPEDAPAVATQAVAAVSDTAKRLAFEDAAQLAERALAVLRGVAAPVAIAELELELASARLAAGEIEAAREACVRAADLAEPAGRGDLIAKAALIAGSEFSMSRSEVRLTLLRRALAALPAEDSELRARLLARLSIALVPPESHEREEQRRCGEEALAMARRLHSDAALFYVMRLVSTNFPEKTPTRERFAVNAELLNLAERLGHVNQVATTFQVQVGCWLELADLDGAKAEVARAERLLAPLPQAHYRWRVPLMRAVLALVEGRFREADEKSREALRLAQTAKSDLGLTMFSVFRQAAGHQTGDTFGYEEFEALTLATIGSMNPLSRFFLAIPDAVMGRRERVREALTALRAHGVEGVPGPFALAWPCVEMQLEEHAEFFYGLVSAAAENLPLNAGPGGFAMSGSLPHLQGSLAALLGRREDAERHFEKAVTFARKLRSPPLLARALLDWARLGTPGARERAEEALALATAHDMPAWAAKGRALLETLAPAKPAPPPVAAAPAAVTLERDGELWVLCAGSQRVNLKHARGLPYLEALVKAPHREVHVLELEGREDVGDAGPMLDAKARQQYRARVEELEEELDEANRFNDRGRAERAREELDALAGELARGVGLGGRERRAGSSAERARVNVQRRLRDVMRRVAELHPALGAHLEASVRTGLFCIYAPTWPAQ